MYKNKYRSLIHQFRGQSSYSVRFKGIEAKFSLADPFSAAFFAIYFKKGVYEEEGLDTLLAEVNSNSVVFDVGANIGYFACLTGLHCSRGSVYAFEMGTENFAILKRNIELNRLINVIAECCAVSDCSGTVQTLDSPVGNAVLKMIDKDVVGDDFISVKSISLDDYCKAHSILPDFVKIDVEGAEMKVLKGMDGILKGKIKILVEIHEKDLAYFHSSKEEVLTYLESFGFNIKVIINDSKKNLLVFAWR